jgi:DNA-binding transcriptional MocR family regulator
LSRGYGHPANPENIFVTAGVSSALDLLCTLFTQSGDTIFVEETTYFVAPRIFADHHLNIVPIAMDENGLIPEALEENLRIYKPKFLYTIPIHHNPTGTTLIEPRRARLLELAQQFDFLILADEVYQLLTYSGIPPKPFATRIENEHVISLGSFSKILAPGLRLGWIQAHATIIKRLVTSGLLDSGGGMNPFTSAIVRGIIETGHLEKNIEKLRLRYQSQLSAMEEALRLHLPKVVYQVPTGGYFLWLRLPEHIKAIELRPHAKSLGVDFRQGSLFSSAGAAQNYIRLCFAHYEEEEIRAGILRLKACLEDR